MLIQYSLHQVYIMLSLSAVVAGLIVWQGTRLKFNIIFKKKNDNSSEKKTIVRREGRVQERRGKGGSLRERGRCRERRDWLQWGRDITLGDAIRKE